MSRILDWADLALHVVLFPLAVPAEYVYRKHKDWREERAIARTARKAQEREDARFHHRTCSDISHRDIALRPAAPQRACPLFRLPVEIRIMIYTLAITDYEELNPPEEDRWSTTQPFHRPGFTAPRRQDTALVRTCRAVYLETWHLPHFLKEQVCWTHTWDHEEHLGEAAPPGYDSLDQYRLLCQKIRRMKALRGYRDDTRRDYYFEDAGHAADGNHTETPAATDRRRSLEIADLRIFPWSRKLNAQFFHPLLSKPDLYPRRITLTFRHVQWMGWKQDQPLVLPGAWIPDFSAMLSPSTREVVVELETVARKKEQVDSIAAQISRRWFFKRPGGGCLYADATGASNAVVKWTGSSVLGHTPWRWVRDEIRDGEIEYHVVRVPFKQKSSMRREARVGTEALAQDYGDLRREVCAPGEAIAMGAAEAAIALDWSAGDRPGQVGPPIVFIRCPQRSAWRRYEHKHWDRW